MDIGIRHLVIIPLPYHWLNWLGNVILDLWSKRLHWTVLLCCSSEEGKACLLSRHWGESGFSITSRNVKIHTSITKHVLHLTLLSEQMSDCSLRFYVVTLQHWHAVPCDSKGCLGLGTHRRQAVLYRRGEKGPFPVTTGGQRKFLFFRSLSPVSPGISLFPIEL